jgi:hypothetical protein
MHLFRHSLLLLGVLLLAPSATSHKHRSRHSFIERQLGMRNRSTPTIADIAGNTISRSSVVAR